MKNSKLFLSMLCGLFMVSLLSVKHSSAQNNSLKQEIVGEWFPLNTSSGGLGQGYTFNEDGKFISTAGAYVAFNYKLEGDTLIMILPGAGEQKAKVEIKNTKLTFIKNEGNTEFTRIAGDINAGIIGKWSGDYSAGTKQIIDFTASKNMYILVPMTSEPGTYKIKGDAVELFGKTNSNFQWSVEADSLTLNTIADEKSYTYIRLK